MQFTNINVDAIELALINAAFNMRANLIEEAIKTINIWLTPDPEKIEVINIIAYKDYDIEQKFSLNVVEQRQLIERMFDDNHSLVFIQKTSELITKKFFSKPQHSISITEVRNYLFPKLALDIKREVNFIKEILSAIRNPRVLLSVEEHKTFLLQLKKFNINLANYYI